MAARAQRVTYVIGLFVGAIEDHMGQRPEQVLEAALESKSPEPERTFPDLSC
jgi:hypothetical protein